MRTPRVQVNMSQAFYDALWGFAAEHQMTPANAMLWATAALLSKSHKWNVRTHGRAFAQRANGTKARGAGLATAEAETGRGRCPQIDGEEV